MHNIGNIEDAETILHWVRSSEYSYGLSSVVAEELAPEGWEYLGRGSFRSVWLSPEGVAYKVEHSDCYGCQSVIEVDNLTYAWSRQVPDGCRLPRFHGYRIGHEMVVAVERVSGKTLYETEAPGTERLYDLMHRLEKLFSLSDMHDENVMVDEDGILVLVDLGN